jgi:hypothetical protein
MPVDGKRSTYTDGIDEWWNLRIPKNANSDPEWHDYHLTWPLDLHAEAIGWTGWNWKERQSQAWGFDFDSITNHAAGIGVSDAELDRVRKAATSIPWVEVRKSTRGGGIHLYVYTDGIPTANHTEHAALGRCVLGLMSSEAGFDFASQIDSCGGIMWVWHRDMKNGGYGLVKAAEKTLSIADLPPNWKDHIEVVTRKRSRVKIGSLDEKEVDPFEQLASGQQHTPLDEDHKAIIEALSRTGYSTVWQSDYHLLQTHTKALADIMEACGIKGLFNTLSTGRHPETCNCFCFPLPDGGWRVYRFSQGTSEADSWDQDGAGWTSCYYNTTPDLETASRALGGIEAVNGEFVFNTVHQAEKVIEALGQKIELPEQFKSREVRLKVQKKSGKVAVLVKKKGDEDTPTGWVGERGKITKVLNVRGDIQAQTVNDTFTQQDKVFRSISSNGRHIGFVARDEFGDWLNQPKDNIRDLLIHLGHTKQESSEILGSLTCLKGWRIVNQPFQPEYMPDRKWNRDAAQYAFQPSNTDTPKHPHWDLILKHCFSDLDEAVKNLEWA